MGMGEAHDCWMCRVLASAIDLPRDSLFALAYATGYGEGMTTARGDLKWEKLALCPRHGDLIRRAAGGVVRAIEGPSSQRQVDPPAK